MKLPVALGALALAALVASSILAAPALAYAQSNGPGASRAEIIDANYSGPVFVDAYWVNSQTDTTKREVGPGDGVSILAMVMVNRGFSDITGVTTRLTLPSGFRPGDGGTGSTVDASYNKLVSAGDTFTVFFGIDITRQAKVAPYPAMLDVSYNKVLEVGTPRTAEMGVQFRVPGKVLMDAASPTQSLAPGSANSVEVPIYNKGSAPATGVVATLVTSSSSSSLSISNSTTGNSTSSQAGSRSSGVNVGTRVFEIGNIPAGQSASIKPTIYPNSAAGGTIQNLTVRLTYGDAYGNSKTVDLPVELTVSPVPPKTALAISAANTGSNGTGLLLSAGKIDDLNFAVTNTASDTLQNIAISVTTGNDSLDILGDSRWTIPSLAPGETKNLSAKVFAAKSLVGTPISFTVTSQYVQGGQLNTDTLKVGKYVAGLVELKLQNLSINYINNVPNLVGSILNQGNTVALYTSVEIVQDGVGLAPSDGRNPGAQGQFSQRSANITAGGEEMLRPASQTPQYLGDLNEDSPMPFSIPLRLARASQSESGAGGGAGQLAAQPSYAATVRITYTDDLGNPHTMTETRNVSFQTNAGSGTGGGGGFAGTGQFVGGGDQGFGQRGGFGLIGMILYIGVPVAAGGGMAAYLIKRRKAKRNKATKSAAVKSTDDDLDAMLDSRSAPSATEKDRHKGS
jgi:hypothetical protein